MHMFVCLHQSNEKYLDHTNAQKRHHPVYYDLVSKLRSENSHAIHRIVTTHHERESSWAYRLATAAYTREFVTGVSVSFI